MTKFWYTLMTNFQATYIRTYEQAGSLSEVLGYDQSYKFSPPVVELSIYGHCRHDREIMRPTFVRWNTQLSIDKFPFLRSLPSLPGSFGQVQNFKRPKLPLWVVRLCSLHDGSWYLITSLQNLMSYVPGTSISKKSKDLMNLLYPSFLSVATVNTVNFRPASPTTYKMFYINNDVPHDLRAR